MSLFKHLSRPTSCARKGLHVDCDRARGYDRVLYFLLADLRCFRAQAPLPVRSRRFPFSERIPTRPADRQGCSKRRGAKARNANPGFKTKSIRQRAAVLPAASGLDASPIKTPASPSFEIQTERFALRSGHSSARARRPRSAHAEERQP